MARLPIFATVVPLLPRRQPPPTSIVLSRLTVSLGWFSRTLSVPQPSPMAEPTMARLPIFATVVPLLPRRQPPPTSIVLLPLLLSGQFSRTLSVPQPSPRAEPTMARLRIFETVVPLLPRRQPP